MSQVAPSPQRDPWFLVRRDELLPDVVMEYDSREEAEDALCQAWVDRLAEGGLDVDALRITIFSAVEMFEDPALRRALTVWDQQVVELEVETASLMDELFLGGDPPILRPGRGIGP